MKKEEKELICEWLDKFSSYSSESGNCWDDDLIQFKHDNGLVDEMLESGKWYHNEFGGMLFYKDDTHIYGLNSVDEWYDKGWVITKLGKYTEATPEEVLERLSEFAIEKGYVEGVKVNGERIDGKFFMNDSRDLFSYKYRSKFVGERIMRDGKWLPIEIDNSEQIKALEYSKQLIQNEIDKLK